MMALVRVFRVKAIELLHVFDHESANPKALNMRVVLPDKSKLEAARNCIGMGKLASH